jgi:hypothetical protein
MLLCQTEELAFPVMMPDSIPGWEIGVVCPHSGISTLVSWQS